jgi:NADP-dependent 3-hydroxy acid dehydrogenase YdfG
MKTIAITGTTRGIGKALAARLESAYNVMHLNRPDYELSDHKKLSTLDFSNVDALILNAGVLDKNIINCPFNQQSVDNWMYTLNANVLGNILLVQQYIKHRSKGTVVFVSGSTVTRRKENSTTLIHSLSKKAMSTFVEDIRYELHSQKHAIRFVDVKPGLTRMSKDMIDHTGRIPTTYDEIVNGIVFALENPSIINIDFEKHQ